MNKNYFKIAWRNLIRNKMSSFINISGLAVGLATGIIIILWIKDELKYDAFHTNLPRIDLVMVNSKQSGEISTGQSTQAPLSAALRSDFPEIKYAAHISSRSRQMLKYGEKSLYERGMYSEPDFFNIMTFPAVEGDPVAALREPGSIVITERTAKKLFGTENPIGKIIIHNNIHHLRVGAVVRDVPENSTILFDVVLPFRIFELENSEWINKWDSYALQTWILLHPEAKRNGLNARLKNLLQTKQQDKTVELLAYRFTDLRLHGEFKNGRASGGRIDEMILLGSMGVFLLLIACINFMNLATAHSVQRSREVGVRKALGAVRKQIILQFLIEALSLTFFALLLGVTLAKFILPFINTLLEKNIAFDFSNWQIWSVVLCIGLLTGLIAGSYPAFFLSSFQPVDVLKRLIVKNKSGVMLRKGLVIFQFVISISLIIATIVILKQQEYTQNRPIGYNPDNLINIPARGDMGSKFTIVKNELSQNPKIKSISAGSDNLVEFGSATDEIMWPGKTPNQNFFINTTAVHYDWIKTTGLTLVEGRDFSSAFGSDTMAYLLNETAVRKMGLKPPIVGTKLGQFTIIGVIKDFVFNDPFASPRPLVVYLTTSNVNHFFVRIANYENWRQTIAQIEQVVKKTNPDYPFEFYFTKEEYQEYFSEIKANCQLANILGAMAIFISCLGLFGLSTFMTEQRAKEIGIRKVLGASAIKLWFGLTREFLMPVGIAFILAVPLAALAMHKLLSTMEYHIELSWWIFAIAGILSILIAVITVSFQAVKAALANPIKALRTE